MRVGFIILLLAGSLAVNGQVVINEVCQNNADIVYDPDFFGFSSWVELYNPANASVNLSGYFLSDSPTLPQRWTFPPGTVIPAKGYLIVWIDSLNVQLHTNFSIEPGGGQILLSSPSSSILDQITYPLQYVNTSYCRVSNGGLPWRQSSEPTPSKANVAGPTNGPLPKVECNMPSGRYAGTVSVFLSQLQAGSEIRYTIDGSEPTKKSNLYASPFNVDTTLVVKAKAYHPDYLPSETVSVTYFMNEHAFTIPVVSLSANPKYLFNDTIGIYVVGINGITGNCSTTPVNFNQDWDRHAVFEYLDISGFRNYQQDLTFRLSGKCSRRRPQKSFALKARKEFGSGKIDYPLFDGKPIKKYDEFFLRNSGQDVNVTQFRDAFMQTLPIGMMDIDYMAYQPAALYINGQYWGIQNLREKIDGDYIENNYGISKNDIDLIQIHDLALEGTTDAWLNYLDSLEILDPLDPNTFKFIEKHVDVQEYINFLALEIYYANPDWPNNIKFWRQRSTNGKFRWILWDTDFGFGLATSQASALHPTLDFAANNPTYPDFSRPIRLALNVPQFRDRFIGTLSSAMGSTLATSRVIGIIDQFQTRLESEMSFHKQRWGGALADWNDEVEELKDFAVARNAFMPGHLASFFNLDQIGLSASLTPSGLGKMELNGVVVSGSTYSPFYKGVDYNFKALPKPGFQFKDWKISTHQASTFNIATSGVAWKYFDSGTLPNPNWKSQTYSDAAWKQGNSQLGYGDGDEQTIVCSNAACTNSNPKYITTYFRRSFTIADTAYVFNLTGSVLFDDGVVVYLNGTEIYRGGMPEGPIGNSTLAAANKDDQIFFAFNASKNLLRNGINTIAAEVHQSSNSSSDISFDLTASMVEFGPAITSNTYMDAEINGTANSSILATASFEPVVPITKLVINEISTGPTTILDNAGQPEDWVELFNNGSTPINLSGLFVSDDLNRKGKFKLEAGESNWSLLPGGYQILWADDDEKQGRDHLSFKLSGSGESFSIYQLVGYDTVAIASLAFGPQPDRFSLARIPNATGPFENTFLKTPGASNSQAAAVQNLVINEFSAKPSNFTDEQGDRDDWIELFNSGTAPIDLNGLFITDTIGNKLKHMLYANGQPWILQPGAYQILWADTSVQAGFHHLSFKLSGSGESIAVYQLTGGSPVELSRIDFTEQVDGFSSSRIPNGTGPFEYTINLTPGAANVPIALTQGLLINEFSATPTSVVDELGDHDDWIELYNAGPSEINLNGLYITDTIGNKLKHLLYQTNQPWIIEPGGYQILWADNEISEGINHLPFKLSSAGESIVLYQLFDGDTNALSRIDFSNQLAGFSTARIPNGTGAFVSTFALTPGEANKEVAPVTGLVLNELSAIASPIRDESGDQDDWIELFNAGTQPIDLAGLFITDDPNEKLKHMLYDNGVPWILQPGGYQLLWADNEVLESARHVAFKLSSGGDEVGMYQVRAGSTVELFLEGFPFQSAGYSLARFPNGSGAFKITSLLTPGDENLISEENQILYPNPARSEFKVLIKEDNASLTIHDHLGRKLSTYHFSSPHEAAIDVTDWSNGFYFVKIAYSKEIITVTLIIQR